MTTVKDKRGVSARWEGAKLDLGCGHSKVADDYVGIDLLDGPEVDIVGDVFDVLAQIPSGSLARVYSSHLFEHIQELERLVVELGRVIAAGGELEVVVPHFSNPYYFSDPTHVRPFGLYTFSYFASGGPLKRKVPQYSSDPSFDLVTVSLGFKSAPPFYGRHALKRVAHVLFNLTDGLKEFYEENLCYLLPCYELRWRMVRVHEKAGASGASVS